MAKTKKHGQYRSGFEQDFHKRYPALAYEPVKITYERHSTHTYTPDFVSASGKFLIELKGRFRTTAEARKYLYIVRSLWLTFDISKGDRELCFIFMNPKVAMPGARRRKDGTKLSHGEWAERHGFKWSTLEDMPKEWRA